MFEYYNVYILIDPLFMLQGIQKIMCLLCDEGKK